MAQIWFEVRPPAVKADVAGKLALIQGVAVVKEFFGTSLGAVVYYDGPRALKRTLELVQRISNAPDILSVNEPFPKCSISLSKQDWVIIKSLQQNPLRSNTEVAAELKLSTRSVQRRISRLSRENAIFLLADMSPRSVEGRVVCGLLVFYAEGDNRYIVSGEIIEKIGDQMLFSETDSKDHAYFSLVAKNVAQANELLDWTRGRSGVRDARLDLVQDIISVYGLYDEQIEKLLKSATETAFLAPQIKRSWR